MTAALEVDAVSRSFGALRAVRDVSLRIEAGERLSILGTNGAGKSTLFNLIAGDFPVSAGRVRLFGQEIQQLPAHRRARLGISRTFQVSRVLKGLSVEENFYVAARGTRGKRFGIGRRRDDDADRQVARECARAVGLADREADLAGSLSYGEQRQLEIGMALAGRPKVILLDEPAAGLSPAERPALVTLLKTLPAAMTVLLIEHDMDVALSVADRVCVMNAGALVFQRTPTEAATSPLVQSLYLGGDAAVSEEGEGDVRGE